MTSKNSQKKAISGVVSSRRALQLSGLVLALLIGLRHILPGGRSRGGSFDAFCPFGGVETLWSYLTTGTTLKTTGLLNFSMLMGVLGMSLLSGRSFCGWICPLGTVQDYLYGLRRKMIPPRKQKRGLEITSETNKNMVTTFRDNKLRLIKYFGLALILVVSVWAVYPPLWKICPARALFSFQLSNLLLWLVLVLFLASSLLVERFSCRYLCPLGAAIAPLNKVAPLRLTVQEENCSGCGRCDTSCPMGIQDIPENLRSMECIQCLKCQENCAFEETLVLRLG